MSAGPAPASARTSTTGGQQTSRRSQCKRAAGVNATVSKAKPSASQRTMGGRSGGGQQGRAVGVTADDGWAWRWWSARRAVGVTADDGWASTRQRAVVTRGERDRSSAVNEGERWRRCGGCPGLQAAGRRSRRPGAVVDADPPCPEGRGWPVARRATQIGPRAERPSPLGIPYGASEASDRGVPGVGGPGGRGAAGGAAAKACSQGDRRMWPRQLSDVGRALEVASLDVGSAGRPAARKRSKLRTCRPPQKRSSKRL